MMEYCAAKPIATARGIRAIRLKSSTLNVNPMHNMIKASINTTMEPWLIGVSRSGQLNAAMPDRIIQSGKSIDNLCSI